MRLALLVVVAACASPKAPPPTPAPIPAPQPAVSTTSFSRSEFAARVALIVPGTTTRDEVERILGRPDDVRTERDPGGIAAARSVEVWRYGATRHLGFGTLATVHVQADGVVQYVFGGKGTPPIGFDETELRRLLEIVAAVPSYHGPHDPLPLIAATNALQPLGKACALEVVDEFLRVSSWLDDPGREGVFLLMRTLFVAPRKVMAVGGPDIAPPADPAVLPTWPIAIAGDIPLDVVSGYFLAGEAEPPEMDLEHFRANGTLRAAPLRPVADPLAAIDAFIEGPLARAVKLDERRRIHLYDQALRALQTVSRPASTIDGYFPYGPDVPGRWTAARAAISALAPRWDAKAQHYVRGDGTTIPPPPPLPPRVWWETGLPGATVARLTLERRDAAVVDAELRVELAQGARVDAATVRMVDPASGALLGDVQISAIVAGTSTTGMVSSRRLALPVGHPVQLELVHAGRTNRGPTLTP